MNIKRNVGIFVIVLIFIIIALIFLIPTLSNSYTYTNPASGEKFIFKKTYTGDAQMHVLTAYVLYKGDNTNYEYNIPLRYGPKYLEDIQIETNINNKILNKKYIYITLDPNLESKAMLGVIDIAKVLGAADYGVFKLPVQGALTSLSNNTNTTGIPVINCKDANHEIGVIWLNLNKENRIYSINECVVVEATNYDNLIKVADRLVYNLLDVM